MPEGARPDPPNRTCRATVSGHFAGAAFANVFWLHLQGNGTVGTDDLRVVAQRVSLAYKEILKWCHVSTEMQNVQVICYQGGENIEANDATVAVGGETGGQILPANVAAVISWHIAPVYKGGHPRTYVPGASSFAQASVNSWAEAQRTALAGHANDFHSLLELTQPIGSTITAVEHGVVSFVRKKLWRQPPVFYRITNGTVDTRIDSQRRRLGRDPA